ncbi:MAG: ATP-binding protein, partial [Capsulimonadaceae bacterium]
QYRKRHASRQFPNGDIYLQVAQLQAYASHYPGVHVLAIADLEIYIPIWELAGGMALSVLITWIAFLAQKAFDQSRSIRKANEELAAARDILEERVLDRTVELEKANQAIRDVLSSVTGGKFRLCAGLSDLPCYGEEVGAVVNLAQNVGIRDLRRQARGVAAEVGFSDEYSQDLETAVGEAAMNAVVHGRDGIGQVFLKDGTTVQIRITDVGSGITMEHLPRATLERGYTTAGTLGHGFYLILNTADRVYLLTSPTGTTVVIEKDRDPPVTTWLDRISESVQWGGNPMPERWPVGNRAGGSAPKQTLPAHCVD